MPCTVASILITLNTIGYIWTAQLQPSVGSKLSLAKATCCTERPRAGRDHQILNALMYSDWGLSARAVRLAHAVDARRTGVCMLRVFCLLNDR